MLKHSRWPGGQEELPPLLNESSDEWMGGGGLIVTRGEKWAKVCNPVERNFYLEDALLVLGKK